MEKKIGKEPECHMRTVEEKTFTSESKMEEKKKRKMWNDNHTMEEKFTLEKHKENKKVKTGKIKFLK